MESILEELIASNKQLKEKTDSILARVNNIERSVEAYAGHNNIMFWELYRQPNEELIDAKKRFFSSLTTNDDFMQLKQRGNKILLKKFVEICAELKLDYWMCAGSLLGIVRHGGFIPWDDDIDVTMPRKDYNRFIAHFKNDSRFTIVFWFNAYAGDVIAKLVFKDHLNTWFLDIYPCDEIASNKEVAAKAYVDFKHEMIAEFRRDPILKPILREMKYDVYFDKEQVDCFWSIFKKYNDRFVDFLTENCGGDKPTGYVCALEDPEDSMVQVGNYQMNEDVYPLQEKMFDEIPVKVIKNYDDYLKNKYVDIYTLPKDIFTHIHIKNKPSMETISSDNKFLDQFKEA